MSLVRIIFFNVLYPLVTHITWSILRLFPVQSKIKQWQQKRYKSNPPFIKNEVNKPVLLVFCASLGEYESVKYLLSKLRSKYVLHISFFSPSGYDYLINQKSAYDFISYTPIDIESQTRYFLIKSKAQKVFLVSSFLWPLLFKTLNDMNIDYYLIDCKIKPLNLLKKTLHKIMLRELKAAQKIYTSDQESLKYMNQIGLTNYSLCEPLRLASIISDQENKDLPKVIYDFQQGNKLFIFASTHLKDIELITTEVVDALQGYKIIVVPHEITKKSIDSIQSKWLNSNLLSRLDDNNNSHDVLIIDQVGMLKHLYSVATACYVGGGFSTGIHNILEPALYDIPIIIGPNHSKFLEAQKLINVKKAIEINNSQDLIEAIYLSMESESIPLKFKELFNTNQIYRDIEMIINDIGSNLTSQDSLLRS